MRTCAIIHPLHLELETALVDLVHLVSFIQPKNQTDQTNQITVFLDWRTFSASCSGLFLLLKKVKQRPCCGGPHSIIRIVKGFLHEGNKFTVPHMPEGSKRHNLRTGKWISRQAG